MNIDIELTKYGLQQVQNFEYKVRVFIWFNIIFIKLFNKFKLTWKSYTCYLTNIINNKLKKMTCILSNIKKIFKTLLNIFVIVVKDYFQNSKFFLYQNHT